MTFFQRGINANLIVIFFEVHELAVAETKSPVLVVDKKSGTGSSQGDPEECASASSVPAKTWSPAPGRCSPSRAGLTSENQSLVRLWSS
jgi:hypothetical protein